MANTGATEPYADGKTVLFVKDCPGNNDGAYPNHNDPNATAVAASGDTKVMSASSAAKLVDGGFCTYVY